MKKFISLKEIQGIQESKKQVLKRTYKLLFQQYSDKIRQLAEAGQVRCTLSVPAVVWGQPTFDRTKAKEWLMRQFILLGFKCSTVNETDWVISWQK